MPSKERTTKPGPEQLDFGFLIDDLESFTDEQHAQQYMVDITDRLEKEMRNPTDELWKDSPYAWVRSLPTARKSRVGEKLVVNVLNKLGLTPARPSGSGHDFLLSGETFKVRISLRWSEGEYTFQQLSAADANYTILVGISPKEIHMWCLPKTTVQTHVDTAQDWLNFSCAEPPLWLSKFGGDIVSFTQVVKTFLSESSASTEATLEA